MAEVDLDNIFEDLQTSFSKQFSKLEDVTAQRLYVLIRKKTRKGVWR